MHKTITNTICTSKNTARKLSLSVSFDTLTVFLCVMTHCVLVVTIFAEDILLPSSGNTYPFNLHHCCHTSPRIWPVQSLSQQCSRTRCSSSSGGTRPTGSKPTHYVQCVCPVTPKTTPIFAMTRMQKCKEINSVRISS